LWRGVGMGSVVGYEDEGCVEGFGIVYVLVLVLYVGKCLSDEWHLH
jgi:hypothetical protein